MIVQDIVASMLRPTCPLDALLAGELWHRLRRGGSVVFVRFQLGFSNFGRRRVWQIDRSGEISE